MGEAGDPPHYFISRGKNFAPKYLKIDGLPSDQVVELVTASAALPLGLLPPVKVYDENVVDGGVADNVPIRPLIDRESCNVLFVFRLNREPPPAADDLVSQHPDPIEHWKRSWRKEDVANFRPNESFLEQDWASYQAPAIPKYVPWRDRPNEWPEIILVEPLPDQDLGHLLDFSEATRLKRETWGRDAALRALAHWQKLRSGGS